MSKEKHTQPVGLVAGIYFGLAEETYHSDPALSHSGMTDLLVSYPDYWESSCYNPKREQYSPTDAMVFGKRCHMFLLEEDRFHNHFAHYGMRADPRQHVFLSKNEYDKIKGSVEKIRSVREAALHFQNGYPEVTIVWKHGSGIMLRCRIDYLHTFGAIDYKRIKGVDNYTIGRAIRDQGLDIQCALYTQGISEARRMLRTGKGVVLGEHDPAWLEAFKKDKDLMFRFLFQRSTPPYIWKFVSLDPDVMDEGNRAIQSAIDVFKANFSIYGSAEPPAGKADVEEITQFHVPRRFYD